MWTTCCGSYAQRLRNVLPRHAVARGAFHRDHRASNYMWHVKQQCGVHTQVSVVVQDARSGAGTPLRRSAAGQHCGRGAQRSARRGRWSTAARRLPVRCAQPTHSCSSTQHQWQSRCFLNFQSHQHEQASSARAGQKPHIDHRQGKFETCSQAMAYCNSRHRSVTLAYHQAPLCSRRLHPSHQAPSLLVRRAVQPRPRLVGRPCRRFGAAASAAALLGVAGRALDLGHHRVRNPGLDDDVDDGVRRQAPQQPGGAQAPGCVWGRGGYSNWTASDPQRRRASHVI